ncbi:MAG TPA: DNA-binding protein [Caulobacteraceae bacterium]
MALFFDAAWFDQRLAERGLDRSALALVARMSEEDLRLAFKDQRELSAAEVTVFAELLGAMPAEVALHAGVSTPTPREDPLERRLREIERRLAAIEGRLGNGNEVD